jgi:tetratricopeptide (TPR) repeat protein
MSALEASDEVCACCGIAAVDDTRLKFCDDCDLVKYCGDGCQENHREQHEDECKERRAELHGKHLFDAPDSSHLGECPLCCLPLPIDESKSTMMSCCSKYICMGCCHANEKREIDQGLEWHKCAFCREPAPKSQKEVDKNMMERVKKDDPVAMTQMGKKNKMEGNYGKALEYWKKAAELGDVAAHACLGNLYFEGIGVEKDTIKALYYWEQAAIGGHPITRGGLGMLEKFAGRFDRAAKHFIIAANLGCDTSLKYVKELFVQGSVSKEEYAAALRGYQSAVNETKSAERKKAEEAEALKRRCQFP